MLDSFICYGFQDIVDMFSVVFHMVGEDDNTVQIGETCLPLTLLEYKIKWSLEAVGRVCYTEPHTRKLQLSDMEYECRLRSILFAYFQFPIPGVGIHRCDVFVLSNFIDVLVRPW